MADRVTITITDINKKRLRDIQSRRIKEGETCSFSKIINEVLARSLKNYKI